MQRQGTPLESDLELGGLKCFVLLCHVLLTNVRTCSNEPRYITSDTLRPLAAGRTATTPPHCRVWQMCILCSTAITSSRPKRGGMPLIIQHVICTISLFLHTTHKAVVVKSTHMMWAGYRAAEAGKGAASAWRGEASWGGPFHGP